MILSDLCHNCSYYKTVYVILRDGSFITASPGDYVPGRPEMVLQIEVVCDYCERVYPYTSLTNPVQLEW